MGIPGFFNTISKNYSIGISSSFKIKSPSVYIDFNSLIYTAKYTVGNILGNFIKSKLGLEYDQSIDFDQLITNPNLISLSSPQTIQSARDLMIYQTIGQLLNNILAQTLNPTVYMYLDGVPYIGKMIEQRKRSLLGRLVERAKELVLANTNPLNEKELEHLKLDPYINLDKSAIKPGTGFMVRLETWLNQTYSNWTIDSFTNPGEAEHKIMNQIINQPHNLNILVYSPDADMIVLLLPLTLSKQIYLVRDSVDKSVYDLSILKQDIVDHFVKLVKPESSIYSVLSTIPVPRIIYDVCFIYNIFGNDFLPKLDNINIYDKSTIGRVLTQYIKYLNTQFKQTKSDDIFLIKESRTINWSGYVVFLEILNKEFPHPPRDKLYKPETTQLDLSIYKDHIWSLNNWGKGFYSKNPDKYVWTNTFYSNTIYFESNMSLESIVTDYFIGIQMVELLYNTIYTRALTLEETQLVALWYYPHHKAPLIQDIYQWAKSNQTNINQKIQSHLKIRLEHFPKSFVPDYIFQLYYITPKYSDFVELVGQEIAQSYPELPQHKIYEEFVHQLTWDKTKSRLNLSELIDCNSQRFIDKCVPLLRSKISNQWVNLVFDPVEWIAQP